MLCCSKRNGRRQVGLGLSRDVPPATISLPSTNNERKRKRKNVRKIVRKMKEKKKPKKKKKNETEAQPSKKTETDRGGT